MPQLSIQSDPAPGFAGQLVYPMEPRTTFTRAVLGTGPIGFGLAVVRHSDRAVRLPAAAGDITGTFEGITIRQPYKEQNGVGYELNEPAAILRKGYIWVDVETAVTEEAPVYARVTVTDAATQRLGAFRGDTTDAALVPNARFMSSTTGPGLAIVEVW